ncbi:hypothetical protein AMS68_002366 [Peltaster fructicola]|uniref:A-kinase anchor protein 7-like phosphoesterase domain-containing protein n=1 Tax=Peltaster fructicola TaxID=286661 RepID=A0A6H0XQF6_9PEZI|nr:hypothetical protein AMS68_002366 [Peltaster fructicola]
MPPRINLPPVTRVIILALISLSTLNAGLRFRSWVATTTPEQQLTTSPSTYLSSPQWAIPYLVLIPTKSLWYPWTFLTAALIENNIISLTVSGAVVWFGGKYLERAWGSQEFGKFAIFVTVTPNFLSFLLYGFWHILTGTPQYPTQLNGLLALSASFLVALKQLIPEHTVSLFRSLLRVRIKHFPALFVVANMVSGPLLGTWTALWLSLFGFLTGWLHLRFFRISDLGASETATGGEGARMRGDPSETFAFVEFFPDVFKPALTPICDATYAVFVSLRLITPFSEEAIEAATEASRGSGLPGLMDDRSSGRRAEAERRRAVALKALDQRLNAAASSRNANSAIVIEKPEVQQESSCKAVRPVGALHCTLGVMRLSQRELELAIDILRSLDVLDLLKQQSQTDTDALSKPLQLQLRGLESMHDPQNTSILYVAPYDSTARLEPLCLAIQALFKEKSLLVSDDRPLKLHATIVNTIYAKGFMPKRRAPHQQQANNGRTSVEANPNALDGSTGHGPRAKGSTKIDAREVLNNYKDFDWASLTLDRIAICEMGAKKHYDDEGRVIGEEYKEVAHIALPT